MKRRSFYLSALTSATILSPIAATGADNINMEWVSTFRQLMDALPNQHLFPKLSASAIYSSKRSFAAAAQPDDASGAAMDLWIAGEIDYLQLMWFREQSPHKRTFICALFLCHRIDVLREPVDGKRTDFETAPSRFGEPEASARLKELEYVKSNVRSLAKEFHTVLSKVQAPEKLTGFAYTAALSDAEHAQLLKSSQKQLPREPKKPEQK